MSIFPLGAARNRKLNSSRCLSASAESILGGDAAVVVTGQLVVCMKKRATENQTSQHEERMKLLLHIPARSGWCKQGAVSKAKGYRNELSVRE